MTDEELREAVRALLGRHEGRRPHVYLDSMGHPSIGIGFNLDRGGARQTLAALGVDYDAVRAGKADLSEDEIDWLFEHDLESAFVSARRQVQNFDRLHPSAKQVVLDMMFMGEGAFAKFRKLIAALQSFDYEAAADEIVKSRWFSQVGARGPENAERMRSAAGR
jgi:GH24 family phage-related lysozyme (muramidase)